MRASMTEQESGVGDLDLAFLAERLQKLEKAMVELQDTQLLEDRIVERLKPRQEQIAVTPENGTKAATAAEPPALAAQPAPAAVQTPPHVSPSPGPGPQESSPPWLIFDIFNEVRNMVAMFFDIHYRVGWMSRTIAGFLICVLIFLPESLWVPMYWIPGVYWVFINLVKLLVAFFVYKLLSREARRYQVFRAQPPQAKQ